MHALMQKTLHASKKETRGKENLQDYASAYIERKLAYADVLSNAIAYINTNPLFTKEEFLAHIPLNALSAAARMKVAAAVEKYSTNARLLDSFLEEKKLAGNAKATFTYFTGQKPLLPLAMHHHGIFVHLDTWCSPDYETLWGASDESIAFLMPKQFSVRNHGQEKIIPYYLIGTSIGDRKALHARWTHERQHAYYHLLHRTEAGKDITLHMNSEEQLRYLCRGFRDEHIVDAGNELLAQVHDGVSDLHPEDFFGKDDLYFAPADMRKLLREELGDAAFKRLGAEKICQEENDLYFRSKVSFMRNIAVQMRLFPLRIARLFDVEPPSAWWRLYRWLYELGYLSKKSASPEILRARAEREYHKYHHGKPGSSASK